MHEAPIFMGMKLYFRKGISASCSHGRGPCHSIDKGEAMKHAKLMWPAVGLAVCLAIGMAWAGEAVNINTASAEQLQKVHGIGAKTAELIVAYRNDHGPFQSIDELTHVKGIGKKTLEKIGAELTTGGETRD